MVELAGEERREAGGEDAGEDGGEGEGGEDMMERGPGRGRVEGVRWGPKYLIVIINTCIVIILIMAVASVPVSGLNILLLEYRCRSVQ